MLRVATTGHRPGRLAAAAEKGVRASLDGLFGEIARVLAGVATEHADVFSGSPRVTLLSSLAEGSDRIAADAALQAGWQLECVLPRPRASYERDFPEAASRMHFDALLAQARVLELDGSGTAQAGYEAAGMMMLNQADLLVAVWDGGTSAGPGGTTALIELALAQAIPVVLIDANDGSRRGVVWTGGFALPPRQQKFQELIDTVDNDPGVLADTVANLVTPPVADQRAALEQYLREPDAPFRVSLFWPLLLWLGGRKPGLTDSVNRKAPAKPSSAWSAYLDRLQGLGNPLPGLADILPRRAEAADRRANHFGACYRSGFVANFMLAALAICLAILGLLADEHCKWWLVLVELGLISYVWWNTRAAIGHRWHGRWLDRRALAERLRHLRLLALAGIRPWGTRPGGSRSPMDWTTWYLLATSRELGIPQGVVDPTYIQACRRLMIDTELADQIAYNRRTATLARTLENRLHFIGSGLFFATLLTCVLYLFLYLISFRFMDDETAGRLAHGFGLVTALLPTLGSAVYAIRAHGDFESVHDRTTATAFQLEKILAAMRSDPGSFALLSDRIERAVEAMSIDVADWRLLFEAKPIALPA